MLITSKPLNQSLVLAQKKTLVGRDKFINGSETAKTNKLLTMKKRKLKRKNITKPELER